MKKMFFVMAVLAAVLIGFAGCNQPNTAKSGNGGGTTPPPVKSETVYDVSTELSCMVTAMGGIEFGKGQSNKGDKYKPLLESAYVTIDANGKAKLIAKFRKSTVNVLGIDANTFIDPRNSTPGYYDTDGTKKDAEFTLSAAGDTAIPPVADPDRKKGVRYVTSMTFPVSKEKSEYLLWIYINSSVMGVQFCDGANTDGAGSGEPNKSTKYVGKITIDWDTIRER